VSDPTRGVTVRDAHAGDRDVIAAFNLFLATETEGKTLDRAVLLRGVEKALADPDRLRYWVAEVEGQVVGQAAVSREWSDWRDGWIWWLQSVYVAPGWRKRGVLRAIVARILADARARGDVIGLRLYVEQDNTAAQQVYRALGLAPGGYHVYENLWGLSLPPGRNDG
jgi:GNAT superfamily N-acetyltransferase